MPHPFAVSGPEIPTSDAPHVPLQRRDSDSGGYLQLPRIFDYASLQDLSSLRSAGIVAVLGGSVAAALALERTEPLRPTSDIDVMIPADDYEKACKILGGIQYTLTALFDMPKLMSPDEPHKKDEKDKSSEASFIEKGKLQIIAGSDGTPGDFSLTDLVVQHSTKLKLAYPSRSDAASLKRLDSAHDATAIGCEVWVCPVEEVMLSKICWGRWKDWRDYGLLRAATKDSDLDYDFLKRRIEQTGTETHMRERYKRAGLNGTRLGLFQNPNRIAGDGQVATARG